MVKPGQFYRLIGLAMLLAIGFGALVYTLVELQVKHHDELRLLAQKNTRRTNIREPLRGQIRDVRGNPLALSLPGKVICADPTLFGDHQQLVAQTLAPILQTNESYLVDRLMPRTREVNGRVITNQYIVLKRQVSLETWEEVRQAMTNLTFEVDEKQLRPSQRYFYSNLRHKAIFTEEDQIRVYPNETLAAHVIGYIGGSEKKGLNGIEASYNDKLAGVQGWRRTETARGRELVQYRDQNIEPRNGYNVVLTIDSGLQDIVERELAEAVAKHDPISISCIMVRPKTGEILAMATLPTYDPHRPQASPPATWRNRVITDSWEPGSTFKIVVVSGALNEGKLKLTDVYNCENGYFYYGGSVLRDHHPYKDLTVEGIITKSSNIGSGKIAIEHLGNKGLYEYVKKFGFGTKTGIPLMGEVGGTVHPTKTWSKISVVQIPMGHGITATPLQTVMAMAAVANGGKLMRPMLVKRLEDENGKSVADYQPQLAREVVSEYAARDMVQALKTVVQEDGGTGTKARLENYTVAGKTGTAQKVARDPNTGKNVYVRKYFASFIGFFPADNPELCISIVMDEPKNGYYGGQTAGPTFKSIAERSARYLNIRPDIEPEPAVKDALAANISVRENGN
ncbi:MAG: penicillin-binding protein 2 [Verrucomicrobia bacterium]|nr:penicillin-binding protein 2 [Verrucomicrobiota bacterium]